MDEVYVTPNADADDKIRNAFGCFPTKDDLISRQAAINLALEYFVEFLDGAFYENGQKELMARFQRLPSAQPDVEKMQDGTLSIAADVDVTRVKRILLTQKGTQNGGLYYRE